MGKFTFLNNAKMCVSHRDRDRKSKDFRQKIKRLWIENQKTMDRKSKDYGQKFRGKEI